MGTNYVVFEDGEQEISLDEHSNRFTLMVSTKDEAAAPSMTGTLRGAYKPEYDDQQLAHFDSGHYLQPDEVVNLALGLLQASLYWHTDNSAAHAAIIKRVQALKY